MCWEGWAAAPQRGELAVECWTRMSSHSWTHCLGVQPALPSHLSCSQPQPQAQPLPTHHCHCSHCTLYKFPKLCLHREAKSGTPTWHRIRTTAEHRVWIKNWQLYLIYKIYCKMQNEFCNLSWRDSTIPISSSCLAAELWLTCSVCAEMFYFSCLRSCKVIVAIAFLTNFHRNFCCELRQELL